MSNEKFIKIILIGDSEVGKTSIINQYINNEFSYNFIPTIGQGKSRKTITIDNKDLLIEVWDTAGQERYCQLNKLFIKNSQIVILVYDITNKESFKHLKTKWFEQIQTTLDLSLCVIGVAANKHDLYFNEDIPLDEAKSFCESKNAFIYETTATEFESINHLFSSLINIYYNQFIKNKDNIVENDITVELSIDQKKEEKSCCLSKKKKQKEEILEENNINDNKDKENEINNEENKIQSN